MKTSRTLTGRRYLGTLAITLVLAPLVAAAGGGHRHHGTHVHGHARLNLAQEGTALAMEFISPAANLLGFEHAPRNPAQHTALEEAVAALMDGAALFHFSPQADCRLDDARVDTPLQGAARRAGQTPAWPREEGARHPQRPLGADPIAGREATHGADEIHSEFTAHYQFHCSQPSALTGVDVRLWNRFPGTERVDVRYVTDRGQGAATLTPGNGRLPF